MSSASQCVGKGDGVLVEKQQGHGVPWASIFSHFSLRIRGFFTIFASVLSVAGADASLSVGFEQAQYQVVVGQPYSVNVVLPPLPNGLFSYGIRLNLPAGKVLASTSDAAVVPLPINYNGTAGAGALRQVTADSIGVKGTVSFDATLEPYRGALLTTFNLKNQAGLGETYKLTLDVFRTLGSTETVFVDGLGANLDPLITFGAANVTVVPEPSMAFLLAIPLAWKLVTRLTEKGTRA